MTHPASSSGPRFQPLASPNSTTSSHWLLFNRLSVEWQYRVTHWDFFFLLTYCIFPFQGSKVNSIFTSWPAGVTLIHCLGSIKLDHIIPKFGNSTDTQLKKSDKTRLRSSYSVVTQSQLDVLKWNGTATVVSRLLGGNNCYCEFLSKKKIGAGKSWLSGQDHQMYSFNFSLMASPPRRLASSPPSVRRRWI